jgi:hypothetical protein
VIWVGVWAPIILVKQNSSPNETGKLTPVPMGSRSTTPVQMAEMSTSNSMASWAVDATGMVRKTRAEMSSAILENKRFMTTFSF